ncbi:MAG: transposase-like protein [Cognaticolwellia sp.]|jgi:transposase-like protein
MGTTRRRRSASEQQQLVHRWQQSSLSKAAFAKQVGISINTLRRWLTSAEPQFLEVVQAEPLAPRDSMVHVGEVCIQIPPGFDDQELRRLMAALC